MADGSDRMAVLEGELAEAVGRAEGLGARAELLEGVLGRAAVDGARRRVLEECAARSGVVLDVGRAVGLLERLTGDVMAAVGDDGVAVVDDAGRRRISEAAEVVVSSVGGGVRVVAPPIAPGERPRRSADGAAGSGFSNAWEAGSGGGFRDGLRKARAMVAEAARDLERRGLL